VSHPGGDALLSAGAALSLIAFDGFIPIIAGIFLL
jgi:hypothetical protein